MTLTLTTSTQARALTPQQADTQSLFMCKDFIRQYGRSDTTDRVLRRLSGCGNRVIEVEARRLLDVD